jgi:8-amino-7-oxononanoate synthase
MTLRTRAQSAVEDVAARNLRRFINSQRAGLIDFASNDYLGLSRVAALRQAMSSTSVVGSGGARLLSGAHPEHAALETELAAFVHRERALLFSSGYLAALGAVQALAPLVTAAYSDERNHASLIDGLRLTKLPRTIFPHGALPKASERTAPALVVTESIFGMSGEALDLTRVLDALDPNDVLVLDEAHALGVYGTCGSGLASGHDDERIVVIGTLSKAFGCAGGFVAGSAEVIELLISTARTFIFDTSMPPPLAAAARAALDSIVHGDALRAALKANVHELCRGLRALNRFGDVQEAPIIPLIVGDAGTALDLAEHLRAQGIFAPAIRPPTVAAGESQIRLVVRADHAAADIEALLSALASAPRAVS